MIKVRVKISEIENNNREHQQKKVVLGKDIFNLLKRKTDWGER